MQRGFPTSILWMQLHVHYETMFWINISCMTSRKSLSKHVLFNKNKRFLEKVDGVGAKKQKRREEALCGWMRRRYVIWKCFPLCFAQGTYIALICQSVNSVMHETVVRDPEEINLWHLQKTYQIICIEKHLEVYRW